MNEATLRRLRERMIEEGLKDPSSDEGSSSSDNARGMDNSENPALDNDNCSAQHDPQTIHTSAQNTEPTHPSTTTYGNNTTSSGQQPQDDSEAYARHVEEQARLLSQFSIMNVGGGTENDVDPAVDQLVDSRPSDRSSSGLGEEVWNCDACGYESNSLMHRFCGLCGMEKAEDWYCFDCQYENNALHRFCGLCGQCRPSGAGASAVSLGYEDLGLDPDDEAAIQNTAARMSQHHATTTTVPTTTIIHPGAPGSHQWDDDDVLTFAEESCADDGRHHHHVQQHQQLSPRHSDPPPEQPQAPQQQQPQQQKSKAWSCGVCTFLNENPLFMCCEMCGSARPAQQGLAEVPDDTPSGGPPPGPEKSRPPPLPSPSSNASDNGPKKTEKRITELMRQQQLEDFQQQQGGGGGAGQDTQLPEPETDHELALIYAQQERILAEYQQQQQRQQQGR